MFDELADVQRARVGGDGRRGGDQISVGIEVEIQNAEAGVGRRKPRKADLTGALTKISGSCRGSADLARRDAGRSHIPAIIGGIAEERVVGMVVGYCAGGRRDRLSRTRPGALIDPLPEPTSLAILAIGLLGLDAVRGYRK